MKEQKIDQMELREEEAWYLAKLVRAASRHRARSTRLARIVFDNRMAAELAP